MNPIGWLAGLAWWVQPAIVLALAAGIGVQQLRVDAADGRAVEARAAYTGLSAQVLEQNRLAKGKLDALTDKARALQSIIDEGAREREKQDEQNQRIASDAESRLHAALRRSDRLCRPRAAPARGPSGRGATSQAAAGAQGGAGNATDAAGLLSDDAREILARLMKQADTINRAYASCRPALFADRAATADPRAKPLEH